MTDGNGRKPALIRIAEVLEALLDRIDAMMARDAEEQVALTKTLDGVRQAHDD